MTSTQESDSTSESISSRSSSIKLLEIGETPIKLICELVAHSQRGTRKFVRPQGFLELAATCKKMRSVCSQVLHDDRIWLGDSNTCDYDIMELSPCVHVSEEIETPLIFPSRGECDSNICRYVHRIIAWYKLASSGLRTFCFSDVCKIAPIREANYIVEYISEADTCIKELRIQSVPSYAIPRIKATLPAFKNLVKNKGSTLESICLNLDMRNCSTLIVDALCQFRLESINSIQLDMSGEDIHRKIHCAMRIIWHALYCGSKVRKICFQSDANNLQYIQALAIICPDVCEVSFIQSGSQEISSVTNVFNFNSQVLRFARFHFNDIQFEQFIQHIATQQLPTELHFHECSFQFGGKMLSKNIKAFGRKIKTLILNQVHDIDTIRAIGASCKRLESLRIEFSLDAFPTISKLLSKSKNLEDVNLIVNGNTEEKDVNMLLDGFKNTNSSIKRLTIRNLLMKPKDLGKLFGFLSDDLESFTIRSGRNQTYSVFSVKNIIKKIRRQDRMFKLRHLNLPLGKIDLPISLDTELGLLKIQKSLINLRILFKHLDVRRLESWVQRPSICSRCTTSHFR